MLHVREDCIPAGLQFNYRLMLIKHKHTVKLVINAPITVSYHNYLFRVYVNFTLRANFKRLAYI